MEKQCSKCGATKPATLEFFNKKGDRLQSRCKPCSREAKRADWHANKDETNERRRAGRGEHERQLARARYRADPRKRAVIDAWRKANPERKKAIDAKHYRKHAETKKAQAREWAQANPDRRRANMREWMERQRRTNPKHRLKSAVSSYVYWCLKNGKAGRKTEEVLGFSMADLARHLERQFSGGMSWDNYGDWHVDHILPVASFSFTKPEDPDFQACWALTNLRPMWASENVSKSDNRLHLI